MAREEEPDPVRLLASARHGKPEALGSLLEFCRNYLRLLARTQIDLHLQGLVNPSDLVQDAMLEALRDFGQFRGGTEAEFLAWLRRILIHNLARLVERHVQTKKRDVHRQVSLQRRFDVLDRSTARVDRALVSRFSSPSAQAQRRELAAILADQLAKLKPDHRDVIVLRNLEGLPFDEVARRMKRPAGAVRMLWLRALDALKLLLEEEDLL